MDWLTEMLGKEVEVVVGPQPSVRLQVCLLEICSLGVVFQHGQQREFKPWAEIRAIREPKAVGIQDFLAVQATAELVA